MNEHISGRAQTQLSSSSQVGKMGVCLHLRYDFLITKSTPSLFVIVMTMKLSNTDSNVLRANTTFVNQRLGILILIGSRVVKRNFRSPPFVPLSSSFFPRAIESHLFQCLMITLNVFASRWYGMG